MNEPITVQYSHNNSGGRDWMRPDQWEALTAAGWVLDGENYRGSHYSAERTGLTLVEAVQEWEDVTGNDSSSLGCACCGTPHSFSSSTGDYYSPSSPSHGDRLF